MNRLRFKAHSRSRIDDRIESIGSSARFAIPVRGWIRAIRDGLGMTSAQLAKRLGISQPSVTALEQSEAKGTMELATLRRVAAALDCTVVYALVPNKPLETTVRDRARALLLRRRAPIAHSMLLENQAVPEGDMEARLDEFLRETNPRRLWDEP
jgi:predicted DNA-binding mobile mystery protein A